MNEVIKDCDIVKVDELSKENEKLKIELKKYKRWYEEIKAILDVYKDLYKDLIERVLERVNDD